MNDPTKDNLWTAIPGYQDLIKSGLTHEAAVEIMTTRTNELLNEWAKKELIMLRRMGNT